MLPGPSRRVFILGALLSCGLKARAQADGHPRVLTLVLPTPPGSQPDLIARWLSAPLSDASSMPTIVVNRPGAAGAIAVDSVLQSTPDTGPLFLGGLDHVAYSHVNSNRRPLDPLVDLVPVGAINRDSWMLVVPASSSVNDLRQLARQGELSYASAGEGSTAHMLTARLCNALEVRAQHVPYRESFLPDLLAGRIHFAVMPVPAAIRQVQGGQLRALTTLTTERLASMPQVPSAAELGLADLVFHGGLFLFTTPRLAPLAEQINSWLVSSVRRPEIIQRYRQAETETVPVGVAQTRAMISERLARVDAMRVAVFGRAR